MIHSFYDAQRVELLVVMPWPAWPWYALRLSAFLNALSSSESSSADREPLGGLEKPMRRAARWAPPRPPLQKQNSYFALGLTRDTAALSRVAVAGPAAHG